MDAVIATSQKFWTEQVVPLKDHWRAVASIVIFVVTLYAVWGKIALLGMVIAGGAAYHYKLPVITFVEMFEIKGVALSAATLLIPTFPFPFNYMAASAISVAYLAHEREAIQARMGLQSLVESGQAQIEELKQLATKCSEMCTEFEQTIAQHNQTNHDLATAQTTAGEVRIQVQEQTQEILSRMQQLRKQLSSNTDLQSQLVIQSQLFTQISQHQSHLSVLKAKISTIEKQILPKLDGLVDSLSTNESNSTACIEAVKKVLHELAGDGYE